MLIGQFCETYPPELDGVGRVMLAYCQSLGALGHRCLYIAPDNPKRPAEGECEKLLYHGVGIPGEPYRIGVPAMAHRFRKAARELPFDVVHAHTPFLAGRAARRIARRRNIPLVATFHSKYYDDFYHATHSAAISNWGVRWVVRFYDTCDEVWAVNERTADVLRQYGFKGEIITMPNGTDPQSVPDDRYQEIISTYSIPEGMPVLLFVGQMNEKKNPQSVLRASALLHSQGFAHYLIMAGDGPDRQLLEKLTAELGLSQNVCFAGFLPEREVMLSLYRRADLLVFPSLYDNAPMVVREAAAMGTPALLIEGTCSAEGITHNENGFLCENNVEAIAQGIREGIPLCPEVGERAKQTIPIPWATLAQQVLARYERLVQQKRERSPA